jgi:hypothetical protein
VVNRGIARELLGLGAVIQTSATAADLERIADGSERRGWLLRNGPGSNTGFRVKRSARDEGQLGALCEWLHSYEIDLIGTVSFSPAYAESHGIFSLKRALADVALGLREIPMVRGTIKGYRGRYVLAGEWHPSGRNVPHVHLALDSMGVADPEKVCGELFRYFFSTRGRSRFEPMRDCDSATLYGLKDTVKASEHDPDSIYLKLGRHSKLRSR